MDTELPITRPGGLDLEGAQVNPQRQAMAPLRQTPRGSMPSLIVLVAARFD